MRAQAALLGVVGLPGSDAFLTSHAVLPLRGSHAPHTVPGFCAHAARRKSVVSQGPRMDVERVDESDAAVHHGVDKKRAEAKRLQAMAAEAAAAALEAEKRAQSVKTGAMQSLAALSQKYKQQSEKERLRTEAEERAAQAARLSAQADQAERERGTTTLASSLSDKARAEIRLADEAERKIRQIDNGGAAAAGGVDGEGRTGVRESGPVSFASVSAALKKVRLIPAMPTRADIEGTTEELDALKAQRVLKLWNSCDDDVFAAGGFRGGSSVLQVRAATKIDPDTPLDVALGLSSYKALQVPSPSPLCVRMRLSVDGRVLQGKNNIRSSLLCTCAHAHAHTCRSRTTSPAPSCSSEGSASFLQV